MFHRKRLYSNIGACRPREFDKLSAYTGNRVSAKFKLLAGQTRHQAIRRCSRTCQGKIVAPSGTGTPEDDVYNHYFLGRSYAVWVPGKDGRYCRVFNGDKVVNKKCGKRARAICAVNYQPKVLESNHYIQYYKKWMSYLFQLYMTVGTDRALTAEDPCINVQSPNYPFAYNVDEDLISEISFSGSGTCSRVTVAFTHSFSVTGTTCSGTDDRVILTKWH